jgi:hypothetical protein
MSKLKKTIMNPWTITVIAPLITIILLKIVDKVAGTEILFWCWNVIISVFSSIYNYLITKYEWRLYQLILLFVSAPVIGLFVLWVISKFQEVKEELEPEWFSYTQDTFDNVVYKWEWWKNNNGKYQISHILKYCSKCECHLISERCPNCRSIYYGEVKPDSEVEALILHRVRMIEKNKVHNHNKV